MTLAEFLLAADAAMKADDLVGLVTIKRLPSMPKERGLYRVRQGEDQALALEMEVRDKLVWQGLFEVYIDGPRAHVLYRRAEVRRSDLRERWNEERAREAVIRDWNRVHGA